MGLSANVTIKDYQGTGQNPLQILLQAIGTAHKEGFPVQQEDHAVEENLAQDLAPSIYTRS